MATARITAAQKTRNWALSCGLSPGLSRFSPASVDIDQLLCLPLPLIPANGFSCSRQTNPYLSAALRSDSITRFWWSVARLLFSKIGAISYWLGGDLVVTGLDRDAELEQLVFGVGHAGQHAVGDRPEVLVLQLLPLGRR